MNRFLVILPAVEMELAAVPFKGYAYTYALLWDDLRSLHGVLLEHDVRLFIDQENPAVDPPKLFLCTVVTARHRNKAYEWPIARLRRAILHLVKILGRGFDVCEHEALVIDVTPASEQADLSSISLEFEKRRVKRMYLPGLKWENQWPITFSFEHEEHVTCFRLLHKSEPESMRMPDTLMLSKESMESIRQGMAVPLTSASTGDADVVAGLYSAALAATSIPVSYLLLWQIVEYLASEREQGQPILDKVTLQHIQSILTQRRYDASTCRRVKSRLGDLKEKSFRACVAEVISEVEPNETPETLEKIVNNLYEARNRLAHLWAGTDQYSDLKLRKQYVVLREIVDTLARKILRPNVNLGSQRLDE